MLTRPDLRLVPAACALWVLAAVGSAGGVRAVVAAAALIAAVAYGAVLLTGRHRAARTATAHLLLAALGLCLLVPGVHRIEETRGSLAWAARSSAPVTLTVHALGDPQTPTGGPEWARSSLQLWARTVPGQISSGRGSAPVSTSLRVMVRGEGTGGGRASAPRRGGPALSDVHAGDTVRLQASVTQRGDLTIIRVRRIEAISPASGLRTALRARAREATAALPADEAALVRGMTTGDTAGLSREAQDSMQRAGISHLIAVSGANIALVLAAVLIPLLLAGVRRRPRLLVGAAVVGGYVALVGEEPSVLRAATMAIPVLVARLAGVRASPVAALAGTIALWSVLSPQTAASIGFALSALATAAILILAPPAARALTDMSWGRIPRPLALVLAVPLVAQAACTPILILLAPEISLWAVLVNILVAPLVGPVTIMGLVALLLGPLWPGGAAALDAVAAGGTHLVLLIARRADSLPGAHVTVPEGSTGAMLACGALVLAILLVAGRRRPLVRWLAAAMVVALVAPPLAARLTPGGDDGSWTIAACAVGQGDATVLRGDPQADGTRPVVLIDTGPDAAGLTACLDALHIETITLLVLTHPHADHIGGVDALTGARAPHEQWLCPSTDAAAAHRPPGPARQVARGDSQDLGTLHLAVLWPASAQEVTRISALETSSSEQGGANDCSVIIDATWKDGTRFLGLGDLEPAAQAAFRDLGPAPVDVLKVAHHGSRRQDPQLYALLHPRLSLIEVGRGNTFGHPAPTALSLLTGGGSAVIRTDQDGTVAVTPHAPGAAEARDEARSVGPGR